MSRDEASENLIGLILALLLLPLGVMLRGWVLATLWRWLIVPVFGVRALSIMQAIGVSVVVGVFTAHLPAKDDETALDGVIRATVFGLVLYGLSLSIGYIVSWHV